MKGNPLLDGFGLALVGTGLAVLTTALVVVPQRIAQRPAQRGVLALYLDPAGQLRLWNRLVRAQEVVELVGTSKDHQQQGQAVLRLVPDAAVPWGVVRQAAAALETSGVPMELQLP
jgi:biopolymer transport protein ExbD